MELVFFYDPGCPYSIKARPYAQAIAKEFKAEYLEYSARDEDVPVLFKSNEYPQFHIVENGEIKKTLKGFSTSEQQSVVYRKLINNYINNIEEQIYEE
jgi:thiol-disulfide isomerase/thioredoxin